MKTHKNEFPLTTLKGKLLRHNLTFSKNGLVIPQVFVSTVCQPLLWMEPRFDTFLLSGAAILVGTESQ